MPGRNRIPDAVKLAENTFREDRANLSAPVATGVPLNPFLAGTIASDKWDEIVPQLVQMSAIAKIDESHVRAFCVAYQTAIKSQDQLEREGMTVTAVNGNPMKNPVHTVWADAWNKVRQFGNDLGLNYLARMKLQTPDEESEDEKAAKYLA